MDDLTEYSGDENTLVGLTTLGVLGAALAALLMGFENFWLVFVIGFAVLVPIVATLTGERGMDEYDRWDGTRERQRRDGTNEYDRHDRTGARSGRDNESARSTERGGDAGGEPKQDALDTLRERYARGDLSEADFEHKVEALLETETPEDARKRVAREDRDDEFDFADERAK